MFIGSVVIISPAYLVAQNMMPPAGPYKSIEGDSSSFNYTRNNPHSAEGIQRQNMVREELSNIPEWVKKRQADMNNWLKQQNIQAAKQREEQYRYQPNPLPQPNQHAMQWNQRQPAPMNVPAQQPVPPAVNPQLQQQQQQINRMKQYFPTSRGPVYGPNVPPPAVYGNPNFQNSAPVNQYPPMWR